MCIYVYMYVYIYVYIYCMLLKFVFRADLVDRNVLGPCLMALLAAMQAQRRVGTGGATGPGRHASKKVRKAAETQDDL